MIWEIWEIVQTYFHLPEENVLFGIFVKNVSCEAAYSIAVNIFYMQVNHIH